MIFIFLLCCGWAWPSDAAAVGAGRARITHISHNGELGVAEPFRATTLTGHAVGLGSRAAGARYVWLLEDTWHQGNPVAFNFTQLGYQTVRLFVCTGSACSLRVNQLSGSSSWSNSWCSSQHSLCAEHSVLVQYVRRELRDLPLAEWRLFADTMVYLKNTPQAVLTERHGAHAIAWDRLASKHLEATLNTTCDHAHARGSFLPYHRLLLRSWERSVQAVHPHLAMPYWDVFYDLAQNDDLTNSSVFSDDYLGTSGVASNGYVVTDGRFAYPKWPIPQSAGLVHERIYGPYGMMRSPTNLNNASHFTRRLNNMWDWTGYPDWPTEGKCRVCMESPNFVELDHCIMNRHSHAHLAIGGAWNAEVPTDGFSSYEQLLLAAQYGEAGDWLSGALVCDTGCDPALGTTACVCYCNDTSHEVPDRTAALQTKSTCSQGMPGDFFDVINSVLDPLFPIYHSIWEKFWVDYQVQNVSLYNMYSGYEVHDSLCDSLDNVLGGETGFSLLNVGLSDMETTPSLTIRQSIDYFLPAVYGAAHVSPYTYKTYSAWESTSVSRSLDQTKTRQARKTGLNSKTLRGQL